jgi:formylglycine-generating enzyme required for sulfatase activity
MKKSICYSVLSLFLLLFCFDSNAQYSKKKLKKYFLNNFQLLNYEGGGVFACHNVNFEGTDTNFLHSQIQGDFSNVDKHHYLIKKQEITNVEYKEFVDWVRDSMYRETLYLQGFKQYGVPIKGMDAFGRNYQINWKTKIDFKDENIIKALQVFYYDENSLYYNKKEHDNSKLVYAFIDESAPNTVINKIPVYPDTLCWIREFMHYDYYNLEYDYSAYYFWHPAFNNYPVVGVNWYQTQAFCHFFTKQTQDRLSYFFGEKIKAFRLPTEMEWMNSADIDIMNPCSTDFYFNSDGTAINVNMGSVEDKNGLIINNSNNKDQTIMNLSKAMEPNSKGISNLHGNVAEWLQDSLDLPNLNSKAHIFQVPFYYDELSFVDTLFWLSFDVNKQIKSIPRLMSTQFGSDLPNYEDTVYTLSYSTMLSIENLLPEVDKMIESIKNDQNILEKMPNSRIIKGGSWNDPLIYLLPQTRALQQANAATATTGFRIVLPLTEKQELKIRELNKK